ncbi:MAG: HD domain-containing phosphohydrolase [Bacillota bacterium]
MDDINAELTGLSKGIDQDILIVDTTGKPFYYEKNGLSEYLKNEPFLVRQNSGELVLKSGKEILFGYSLVNISQWGVLVAKSAQEISNEVALSSAPWFAILVALFAAMMMMSAATIRRNRHQQIKMEVALKEMENKAYIDPLTGIHNHRHFQEVVELKVTQKQAFTLMLIDIDNFRFYNDSFGMEAGDRLIKNLVEIVLCLVPAGSEVSRYGADQVAIIFPEQDEKCLKLAQKICETVKRQQFQQGSEITISTGISQYPRDGSNREELIRSLEQALHESKDTSGNIKVYFSALQGLRRSFDKSEDDLYASIRTLLGIIHAKDQYTLGHTERVVNLSTALAQHLGLSEDEIKIIRYGAYLHDIGKIEIDYFILNKDGPLTMKEWSRIRAHPQVGAKIIRQIRSLEVTIPIVLYHHENFDGKGYPDGLAGEEIPLYARIVAIADSYDAMTTRRSYRKAFSREKAMKEISAHAGTQFDPQLVEVFLRMDLEQNAAGLTYKI